MCLLYPALIRAHSLRADSSVIKRQKARWFFNFFFIFLIPLYFFEILLTFPAVRGILSARRAGERWRESIRSPLVCSLSLFGSRSGLVVSLYPRAAFLALQGFFDAFHLLYEKICSEFFTNGRFCGIIPEELFHGKSSGLSPLRGLSPACGIDGFAKMPLQASIFASWYHTRRRTVLRLRQIGWALTPQQEQNFDSVCFKTALLRLSRKGGKLHHGNDHHCIRRQKRHDPRMR